MMLNAVPRGPTPGEEFRFENAFGKRLSSGCVDTNGKHSCVV